MLTFRASRAGHCTREIVLAELKPEVVEAPEAKIPFLEMGVKYQEKVTEILEEQEVLVTGIENTVIWKHPSGQWRFVGHIDGVIETGSLLEVKAITSGMYQKLLDKPWMELYPGYVSQAQVYLAASGASRTKFIFANRDSMNMVGGLGIKHDAYTFRKDMILRRNTKDFTSVILKHEKAFSLIKKEEAPEECDNLGWCFFCQQYGSKTKSKSSQVRTVSIEEGDEVFGVTQDYQRLSRKKKNLEAELKDCRDLVESGMRDLKADALSVEAPDGDFTLTRTEVSSVRPDKDEIKSAVERGEIHKVESSYYRLTLKELDV